MSVSDPQYTFSYYKAVKLDDLAAKCLHSPQIRGYSALSGGSLITYPLEVIILCYVMDVENQVMVSEIVQKLMSY
jgi:hypothetical protein